MSMGVKGHHLIPGQHRANWVNSTMLIQSTGSYPPPLSTGGVKSLGLIRVEVTNFTPSAGFNTMLMVCIKTGLECYSCSFKLKYQCL